MSQNCLPPATEARKLVSARMTKLRAKRLEYRDTLLSDIGQHITKLAESGRQTMLILDSVDYANRLFKNDSLTYSFSEEIIDLAISSLKENGYLCSKTHNFCGVRLEISWEEPSLKNKLRYAVSNLTNCV